MHGATMKFSSPGVQQIPSILLKTKLLPFSQELHMLLLIITHLRGKEIFIFSRTVQTGCGPHTASYSMVTRVLSLG